MRSEPISTLVLNGAVVVASATWIVRVGALLSHVILARVLTVEEYGVAVIALVIVGLQQLVPNLGYASALIQTKPEPSKSDINTAWTVDHLITRSSVALVIFYSGSYIAAFFSIEAYEQLVLACAVISLFAATENFGHVLLARRLEYKRRSLLVLSSGFVTAITTIVIVVMYRTPWAVVWGAIAGQAARTAVSYIVSDHSPRVRLDNIFLRRHLHFAFWMVGVGFLTKLRAQLDKIVVGGMLGAAGVAAFQIASRISIETIRDIVHGAKNTLFPAIARMQDDSARMREGSLLVLEVMSILGFCLTGMIALIAEDIVPLLFGAKWEFVIPAVRITCVAAWFLVMTSAIAPIIRGAGHPRLEFQLNVVVVFLLAVLVSYLSARNGIIGAVWGLCLAEAGGLLFALYKLCKITKLSVLVALGALTRPLVWFAAPLVIVAMMNLLYMEEVSSIVSLMLASIITVLGYVAMAAVAYHYNALASLSVIMDIIRRQYPMKNF